MQQPQTERLFKSVKLLISPNDHHIVQEKYVLRIIIKSLFICLVDIAASYQIQQFQICTFTNMMPFGNQIDGSTPNACWKEIYCRIKEKQCNAASELEGNVCQRSGSDMFGFSNPQIRQLIQVY